MDEEKMKDFLTASEEFANSYNEAMLDYRKRADEYWNNLTEEEQEYAFFSVVHRMYKAEVEMRTSYRGAIYEVFGFDPSMYSIGMECGYMDLHNIIWDGLEYEKQKMEKKAREREESSVETTSSENGEPLE